MIGDLPAIPGRLYVREHVLCLYWHEPASNCSRLSPAGVRLLKPFTRLPFRHGRPTTIIEVRYHSRRLRYANGNIFAALEKLGLHLEKSKAPREFIVIEHIERPSEN